MSLPRHDHTQAFAVELCAAMLAATLFVGGCCGHHNHASTGSNADRRALGGTATSAGADSDQQEDEVQFSQTKTGVPQPGQRTFGSPEQAAGVFKDAVAAQDRRTLVAIFGPEGKQLIFSGDRIQEDNDLRAFDHRLREYLKVERPSANMAVLHIGSQNWPFPIPLVSSSDGWFFDTAAGRDELLNRHIGEDELNAIAVSRAYVEAQREYIRKDRTGDRIVQYAQHLMSHPGKKDGLYWDVAPGEELSPMGPLVAEARLEGYPATRQADSDQGGNGQAHQPHPYQGYIFHILKAQGDSAPGGAMNYIVDGRMTKGFAMVASPSKYGASGIMTFIVGKDGKVYQKDLGPDTRQIVSSMTAYNPDKTWEQVKD